IPGWTAVRCAAVKGKPATEIVVEFRLRHRGAMEIDAELYVVLVHLPGKVVEGLVVAIDTVPGNAGRGAELGNSTHKHVRQARIGRPRSGAQAEAGCRTHANGTGVKILIEGIESFGKTVPAVAQFIHLIGTERVHIGDGGELYAGRGESVEAGQLAAFGCESEWERLHAVAEEIAAGEDIVGVEVLIDLHNHAGQIVVRRRDDGGLARRRPAQLPYRDSATEVRCRPWITSKQFLDHAGWVGSIAWC